MDCAFWLSFFFLLFLFLFLSPFFAIVSYCYISACTWLHSESRVIIVPNMYQYQRTRSYSTLSYNYFTDRAPLEFPTCLPSGTAQTKKIWQTFFLLFLLPHYYHPTSTLLKCPAYSAPNHRRTYIHITYILMHSQPAHPYTHSAWITTSPTSPTCLIKQAQPDLFSNNALSNNAGFPIPIIYLYLYYLRRVAGHRHSAATAFSRRGGKKK